MSEGYVKHDHKNEFKKGSDTVDHELLRYGIYPLRNSNCAQFSSSNISQVILNFLGSLTKPTLKRIFQILIFLLTFLVYPHLAFSSGIGLLNFNGDVTITNTFFSDNYIGIQATVTNAATIDNIWIFSNNITDSRRHGIKIDFNNTGSITIENNFLDNSNVPSAGPYTKNGRYGIRIQNHPSPSIANNTIQNFGRSGIQLQSITNITVVNNFLYSNGRTDYSTIVNGQTLHNGAGLQALNSTFSNVSDNIITSNLHAGIAAYSTGGTVGPNNIIQYDGNPELEGTGAGFSDCAAMAGGPGSFRGGIMVQGLQDNEVMSVDCSNTISDNYYNDVIKTGEGIVNNCGNYVETFFATADDAVYYYDINDGHVVHDCTDGTIDATGKPFGIIIVGEASDVTIQNCTIRNAAMQKQYAVTTGNGNIVGAGIFIANGATPLIQNNYIISNGWDVLDDRIYTEAGASGIQMRCGGSQTSIINNIIASNANDGLAGRETGGLIGVLNQGNTFRNNGRNGVGFYDGTTRNLEVAYNTIHHNKRGIGAIEFDGDMFTIANNFIYSNNNQDTDIRDGGAIGLVNLADGANVVIKDNTIVSNYAFKAPGGIGIKTATSANVSVMNNSLRNNSYNTDVAFGTMCGLGAVDIHGGSIYVFNNVFSNNTKGAWAAGQIGIGQSTATNVKVVDNYFAGVKVGNKNKYVGQFDGVPGCHATLDSLVFSGNELDCNNQSGGIKTECSKSFTFTGNKVYNYRIVGMRIRLKGNQNPAVIDNNEVYSSIDAGNAAIRVRFPINTVNVRNNTTHNAYYGIAVGGRLGTTGYTLIASNYSYKNEGAGIQMTGERFYVPGEGATVRNNVLYSNNTAAIQSVDLRGLQISSNQIWSNCTGMGGMEESNMIFSDQSGMDINEVKLDDFSSDTNDYYNRSLIYVDSGVGSPREVQIVDYAGSTHVATVSPDWDIAPSQGDIYRVHRNRDAAVRVRSGTQAVDDNTTIFNNNIHDNNGFGIALADYKSDEWAIISDNTIVSNSYTGIGIGRFFDDNQGSFTIDNSYGTNIIRNNGGASTLDDTGGAISATSLAGDLTVSNNLISNNIGSGAGGIGISASNATLLISGNTIQNNAGAINGLGLKDSDGNISIMNNIVFSNDNQQSGPGGIGFFDLAASASVWVEGNSIYNNDGWKASGIGISNSNATVYTDFTIYSNSIIRNGNGGLGIWNASLVNIQNNIIVSNGWSGMMIGDEIYGSGIQARQASFDNTNITDNTIRSNWFAGIAAYSTVGSIGANNTIQYNGVEGSGSAGEGGMQDCMAAAGAAGDIRGGVLARGMSSTDELSVACVNDVINNYENELAKTGGGILRSCTNVVSSFFASNADTVFYFDDSSGTVDLNCADYDTWSLDNATIDAAVGNKKFGVIIIGASSDVTVRNCTIKNAAMNDANRATVNNQGETKYIGAGVFISNNASPHIYSNYIFSNGWDILDDRIYTEAGASGIQMRCGDANTSIYNNIIASNRNDGLVGRETGGVIGLVSQGNTFRNNGRGGIGIYDGTTRNIEIAYNTIYNNKRGIGAVDFDGDMITIANNYIYSNEGADTKTSGGIGFRNLADCSALIIKDNIIASNKGVDGLGGIGFLTTTNASISVTNNSIRNNSAGITTSGLGGEFMTDGSIYLYNNVFYDNRKWPNFPHGQLGIKEANIDVKIVSNYIGGDNWWGNYAVSFEGEHFPPFPVTTFLNSFVFSDNEVDCNGTDGLTVRFSKSFTITGNKIYDFDDVGMDIGPSWSEEQPTLIEGNEIYNGIAAIRIKQPRKRLIIRDNTTHNAFNGIAVQNRQHSTSDDYTLIASNYSYKNSGTGIRLKSLFWDSSAGATVRNNVVYSNHVSGIQTQDVEGLVINGNHVWSNGLGVGDIMEEDRIFPNQGTLLNYVTLDNSSSTEDDYYNNSLIYIDSGIGSPSFVEVIDYTGSTQVAKITPDWITQPSQDDIYHLTRPRDAGIRIRSGNHSSDINDANIYDNNVHDNDGFGISFADHNSGESATLSDNVITSNSLAGIAFGGLNNKGSFTIDNSIGTNIIRNNDGGIGISKFANPGNIVITGNEIYDNIDQMTGGTGGIGIVDGADVSISVANNLIYSNIGAIGGIGVTASNGTFSFVNNQVMNNIGSSLDPSLHNVGGIGFNAIGTTGNIFISDNTLQNNRALVSGGPERGRVGGIGFSNTNATVSVINNTIANNNGLCIGGNGFDLFGGSAYIASNLIYSNTNNKSSWGAGGLAFDEASGDITVSNNEVYNNSNQATGSGGIGINIPQATASFLLEENTLYNNEGARAGAIGINQGTSSSSITITNNLIDNNIGSEGSGGIGITDNSGILYIGENNSITNNSTSGIGATNSSSLVVVGNVITSNGSGNDGRFLTDGRTAWPTGVPLNQVSLFNTTTVNDFYNGMYLLMEDTAATPKIQLITDYDGPSKTATISPGWDTQQPAYDDPFHIMKDPDAGIRASSCANVSIENNTIKSNDGFGIAFADNSSIYSAVVIGNSLTNNTLSAISLGAYKTFSNRGTFYIGNGTQSGRNYIADNGSIYTDNLDFAGGIGFWSFDGTAKIDNNLIVSNAGEGAGGIGLNNFPLNSDVATVSITNNLIKQNKRGSNGGPGLGVNNIKNNSEIYLFNNIFSANNVVWQGEHEGQIGLRYSVIDAIIISNYFKDGTSNADDKRSVGISLSSSPQESTVIFSANTIDANHGAVGGFYATQVEWVRVTGNTIFNFLAQGIAVDGNSSTAPSTITNNLVYSGFTGDSQQGTGSVLYGEAIVADGLDNNSIMRNNTVYNAGRGLRASDTTAVSIDNNVLYSTYLAAIDTNNTDDSVIFNNLIHDNTGAGIRGQENDNLVVVANFVVSNGTGDPILVQENVTLGTQKFIASDFNSVPPLFPDNPQVGDLLSATSPDPYVRLNAGSDSTPGYYDDMFLHLDSGNGSPKDVRLYLYDYFETKDQRIAKTAITSWTTPPREGDLYHITRIEPDGGIRQRNPQGNLIVKNNTVRNNKGFGLSFSDNTVGTVTVSNNIVASNYYTGVAIGIAYSVNNQGKFFIDDSIGINYIRNNGYGGNPDDKLTGGIGVTDFSGDLTINNNVIYSNNYAGIQSFDIDASGYSIVNNQITSNKFAGIAFNMISAGTTIGPNNEISYNGDPNGDSGGGGGGMVDCVISPGGGGNVRGGVLIRDLAPGEEMSVMCTNTFETNYFKDVAKTGTGTVYSCGNTVTTFFADSSDAMYYFEGPTTYNLDCSQSASNIVNAVGKPFGIIILGSDADVTVQNCTIKNAAMDPDSWAETGDGSTIGAGIYIANNATPSISNNYIFSNGWGVLQDGMIGSASAGIVMRCSEASTSIVNNIIASNLNDGLIGRESGGLIGVTNEGNTFRNNGRGGIGIYDGTTRNLEIAYNAIHNNQRAVGVMEFDGDALTISNNQVYSNVGNYFTAGIGLNSLQASASVLVKENSVYNNTGQRVSGIGVTNSNTTDITIFSNTIFDNNQSGVGIFVSDYLTVVNNQILSNGLADEVIGDEHAGFGIQLKDSIFDYNNIYSNTIRHNRFAGVGFYNVGGTIGPNNSVVNNGDEIQSLSCLGVGNGYGGISARELSSGDLHVLDSLGATYDTATNMVIDNYYTDEQHRRGSGSNSFSYNNKEISSPWFGPEDAIYFFDGTTDTPVYSTVDCGGDTLDASDKSFGIIALGPNADVTVQNCTIRNAGSSYDRLEKVSPFGEERLAGAGILVAANASVSIVNNYFANNGMDMTRARLVDGPNESDSLLNFFWAGGGAVNEQGLNEFWVDMPTLSSAQNKIIYLYSGNPDVEVKTDIDYTLPRLNQVTETDRVSLWQFDNSCPGGTCSDTQGTNHGTTQQAVGGASSPSFYANDFRFFHGLLWQNIRDAAGGNPSPYPANSLKNLRLEENYGEDGYVAITDGSPSLDLTGSQTIMCWFSTGPGPLYTRKPNGSTAGGVELSVGENNTVKFRIENSSSDVYSVVTPDWAFDEERANAHYVAALFSGANGVAGKMKLFLSNVLVVSSDVSSTFGNIDYGADSTSYIGAVDADGDGQIEVGETFYGLIDEVAVYNTTLSNKRIEAHHYHRRYDSTVETYDWPTITMGAVEKGAWTLTEDSSAWSNRWPVTISNVNANLTDFPVGPVEVQSPDSGGIMMRCVDENVTVVNNTLWSNRRDGISGYDILGGALIANNTCHNNERFGIGISGTIDNVSIEYNTVYSNDRGIGGNDVRKGSAPYTIANNYIYDNLSESQGWKRFGIMFTASNNWVIIDGNSLENNVRGIGFQNCGPNVEATIKNNTIQNHSANSINIEKLNAPNGLTILNNYIYNNNTMRIRYNSLSNIYLKDNTFEYNLTGAIQCNDCGDLVIDNNLFTDNSWISNTNSQHAAVRLEFQTDGSISKIKNNMFNNNRKNGVQFQDCNASYLTIANNTFKNNSCREIEGLCGNTITNLGSIQFKDNDSLAEVLVDNNLLDGNYSDPLRFKNNDNSNVTITNNTITNNTNGWGMDFQYIRGGANYIAGNSIDNNATGLWFQDSNGFTIQNNSIVNNNSMGIRAADSQDIYIGWDPGFGEYQFAANTRWLSFSNAWYEHTSTIANGGYWANEDIIGPGKLGNVVEGNVWTLQIQGYDSATNIHLQGNKLAESDPGSGGLGVQGSLANVTIENCQMSDNGGDVGAQYNGILTLKNSRVVGGDMIQARFGGKLYLLDGCQINILSRVEDGSSASFQNYNYVGCISGCSAGGEPDGSSGDYTLIGSNYVGGRVKFNGSTNYFSRFNQVPAGFDMYDSSKIYAWWGNSFGSSQKKHSSEFWLVGSTGFDPSDPWNTMLDGDQVSNSLSWLRAMDGNSTRIVRNYFTSGSIDHDSGDLRFYNNTFTNFAIKQGLGGGSFLAQDNIFSGVSQGFKNTGNSSTVTGNTFKNCNTSFMTGADSVNISNNYFENNTMTAIFSNTSSATVSGNTLKNNTRGVRSTNTSGTLTIADNVVYSTEYNGISLNASSATISIRNNELYANNMEGTGAMMFQNITGTVAVSNNNIHDNYLSGISYTLSNNINIYDNLIVSNGLGMYEDSSGRPNASGIRAKDSTFLNISSNTIRNNTYAGVSSYATDGYIGPDNTITNNGDPNWQAICTDLMGPGSGHGGIAVRDLEDAVTSNTLIVSNNVLENNFISTIAWKDCQGTIRLDGTDWTRCGGSNPTSSDAKVFVASNHDIFVDGVSVANSSVVECGVTPGVPANITGGNPWGLAITPGTSGITVKNCSIYNNNTTLNDYGPNGTHIGGGLFIGLDVEAEIYSNVIHNNGVGYQDPNVLEEGGHAGVVLACANSDVTLKNNQIYDNSRDGVNIRGGSPTIGILGEPNEIYDNGRHGIGCSGSTEALIAYNTITNNTRLGVGNREFAAPTIHNNSISHHIAYQKAAGVGMIDQSTPYVYSNWLYSNEHGVGFGNGNAVRDNTLAIQSGMELYEVKLDAGASVVDDKYNGKLLVLDDTAIGSPKEAMITGYVGSTKVATIDLSWSTIPSSTDGYRIFNVGYRGTVTVKNNDIYSSRRDGVGIWAASFSNIIIDGNDIQNSVEAGVSMRYVEDSQITVTNSPTIANSGWSIRGEYNTDNTLVVASNPYINNGTAGVALQDNTGIVLKVSDNLIFTCDRGIEMRNNDGGSIEILNNSISNSYGTGLGGSGVQIENHSDSAGVPLLDYMTIKDNVIFGNSSGGIRIRYITFNNSDLTIDNNVIVSNTGDGIVMEYNSLRNYVLTDNSINSNSQGGAGARYSRIETIKIINNTMANNTGAHGGGVFMNDHTDLVDLQILSNYIDNNTPGGVLMENMDATSTNLLIRHNSLINNAISGLVVNNFAIADYFTLSNNFIDNNGNGGFYMKYTDGSALAIINNIITSCNDNGAPGRGGISLEYNGFVSFDIIDNKLNNHFDQGIKISSSNFTTFNFINNTVNNNGDAGSESGFSMNTSSIENTIIASNIFNASYDNGLQMQDNGITAGMSIRNNTFTGNGGNGFALADPVTTLDSLFIGDNFIVSNANAYGMLVDGYSVNSLLNLKNNTFRNNNYRAFKVRGGSSGTIAIVDNLIASHKEMGFGIGIPGNPITMDTLVISNNTIRNNGGEAPSTVHAGGGFGLSGGLNVSDVNITGNFIVNNEGTDTATNTSICNDVGGMGVDGISGSIISISNNIIAFNTATGNDRPGGLGLRDANSTIVVADNEIYSNVGADQASGGIGIKTFGTSIGAFTIERNIIRHNTTGGTGGGIGIYFDSAAAAPVIRNNMIFENTSSGIKIAKTIGSYVDIVNNTIAYNSNYGIDNGCTYNGAWASITNCILWGNTDDLSKTGGYADFAATYSDIEDTWDFGDGNIYIDPNFVNVAADNYHISDGYAVDSGTIVNVSDDYDGDSRPAGVGYDMGADECASCSHPGPTLNNITLADRDNLNNPDAEFTNETIVNATLSVSNNPTDMMLCEDSGFSGCNWVGSYSSPTTFTFANVTNESKIVYATVKNAYGGSPSSQNDSITLDNVPPALGSDALTTPSASGITWTVGNVENITWNTTSVTNSDLNLKPDYIKLDYDTSSGGGGYSDSINSSVSNSGSYSWTVANEESSTVKVQMAVFDKAGNTGTDASDNDFTITAGGGGGGPTYSGCSTPIVCPAGPPTCTYSTIQAAIDATSSGEICVGDGTYAETVNFGGKGISLVSENGPASTTIDGDPIGGNRTMVTFNTGNTASNTVLKGFTVKGGYQTSVSGAGVVLNNATATLDWCIIESNRTPYGAGIYATSGSGLAPTVIVNSTIRNNNKTSPPTYGDGGAMKFTSSAPMPSLENCVIRDNYTKNQGTMYFNGASGALTLINSLIVSNDNDNNNGGPITADGISLYVDTATFRNNTASSGGAIFLTTGGDVTILNSQIWSNSVNNGYAALYLAESASSAVSIANTDISNNSGPGAGGGLYISGSGSTLSLVNSIMTSNDSNNYGGALYVGSGVDFYSDAITLRNNYATVSAGALYVNSNGGNIEILNSQVRSNAASSGYGSLYFQEAATSTVSIANTDISNNTGTSPGGGINISGNGAKLSLINSTIKGNTPGAQAGGGIYANTGVDLYFEDSSINSNVGRFNGGGIFASSLNNFTMKNCNLNGNYFNYTNGMGAATEIYHSPSIYIADSTIQNNTGYSYGGAIHISGDTATLIERSYFRGNDFQVYTNYNAKGGAIYFTGNGARTIRNSVFSGNKARFGGGIFHNANDINTVYMNTSFSGNHATESGGGIYGSTNGLTITNSIVYSNAADSSNNNIRGTHTISYTNDGDAMLDCTPGDNPNNNMTCTPSFVSPLEPSSAPTVAGDYHLQSGSSCIDNGTGAGAPSDDIDGDTRSGSIDMGADEYVP